MPCPFPLPVIALVVFGEECKTALFSVLPWLLVSLVQILVFPSRPHFSILYRERIREWGSPVRYTGVHAHHKAENGFGTLQAVYKEDLALLPGVKCKARNPLENISYSINMRMDIVLYLSWNFAALLQSQKRVGGLVFVMEIVLTLHCTCKLHVVSTAVWLGVHMSV
jgi:hypothetical protein